MKIKYKDNESILSSIDNILSDKKRNFLSKNMIHHYIWSISRNLSRTLVSLPTTEMLIGEEPIELEYSDVEYFMKRITETDKFKKIKEGLDNTDQVIQEITELAEYVLINFKGYTEMLYKITNVLTRFTNKLVPIINSLGAGVLIMGYCDTGGY